MDIPFNCEWLIPLSFKVSCVTHVVSPDLTDEWAPGGQLCSLIYTKHSLVTNLSRILDDDEHMHNFGT